MSQPLTISLPPRFFSLTPIVRGKAGKPVEFGAKLSASCFEGYAILERISWNNFNESGDFKAQVEAYRDLTGSYPESVHVDKIYRTRENRAWCKERGIRISGPPLLKTPNSYQPRKKRQALDSEKIRNSIEGKFGQAKRRFSLSRVMAKLTNTSLAGYCCYFFSHESFDRSQTVFLVFLCRFLKKTPFYPPPIISSYLDLRFAKDKLMNVPA